MEEARNKFGCLQAADDGAEFMEHCYDALPYSARKLLSNSNYNICAACFEEALRSGMYAGPEEVLSVIEAKIGEVLDEATF
jgi:hypothetical protein